MSDQQEQGPLWTDAEIIAAYRRAWGTSPDVHHMAFVRMVRDDMQAKLDAAQQRIAKLEGELAQCISVFRELSEAVAEGSEGDDE